MSTENRNVDTPYGPMVGCPDCDVIKLWGSPHVCEHGVTPAPQVDVSVSMEIPAGSPLLTWMRGDA